MPESEVLVARDADARGVAVVTLNAPSRRNVLSVPMVAALSAAFDELEAAGDVNCVVVTGSGSAFCAGAELSTLENASNGEFDSVRIVYDGFLRVLRSPLPTLAAINGPAVGAGYNLALACDLRLAGSRARFDTRFAALNIIPGGGHTWLLTQAVGAQQATLATLFGEVWDAPTALARGLVVSVHETDQLLPAALALGSRLAAHDPDYTRRFIAMLRLARSGAAHQDVFEAETQAQLWSLQQPAFLAGLAAIRARIAAS